MRSTTTSSTLVRLALLFMTALAPACARASAPPGDTASATPSSQPAARLNAGVLRPVNRDVTPLADAAADAVRSSSRAGSGIAWIEGSDFVEGELSVGVRGKDVLQQSVQYVALPDYDWPRLRQDFPEEFENPVDASLDPTGWVTLRVVVKGRTVQVFAGAAATPALAVRKLGTNERGLVGLWVGNNSDGDFANLRITPMK